MYCLEDEIYDAQMQIIEAILEILLEELSPGIFIKYSLSICYLL